MKARARLQQLTVRLRSTRTVFLATAGLGCITAAFWTAFGLPAGLGTAGVALLVLEYLSGEDPRR